MYYILKHILWAQQKKARILKNREGAHNKKVHVIQICSDLKAHGELIVGEIQVYKIH